MKRERTDDEGLGLYGMQEKQEGYIDMYVW